MNPRHVPLAVALAAGLLLATPARAEDNNANCNPPNAEEQATIDAWRESNMRIDAFARMFAKACDYKRKFMRLFKTEPDPEKVTNDMLLEAAKPEVDPVLARMQNARETKAAVERMKMREERLAAERRNSNPANEAVTAANERDARERVPEPVPLTPAAAGETPPAPPPVIIPPAKKGGFITIFEGRQDAAPGTGGLTGEGTAITPAGIQSGTFRNGELQGRGEEVTAEGTWRGGNFENGEIEGRGFEVREDARGIAVVEADFKDDKPDGVVEVAFEDGSSRRDLWQDGKRVAMGEVAAFGQAPSVPVYKSPEMLAAEENDAFQARLKATPNPGALYALADEMAEKGDSAKARMAYRQLLTRFPASPLATRAAEQLTPSSAAGASAGAGGRYAAAGNASGTNAGAPAATSNRGYRFTIPDPVLPPAFYQQYTGHGLSVAECTRQGDAMDVRIRALNNRLAGASTVDKLRAVLTVVEAGMVVLRQCEDTPGGIPGGDAQMKAWLAARAQALINCQQMASDREVCTKPLDF